MQQNITKFGRPVSPGNAPFYDRISSVGYNQNGALTWMASCATEGCPGELRLEMLRRHGNQKCDRCAYTVIFDGERVSRKLLAEKHRIVAVSKINGSKHFKVKDWWMRCGEPDCMNVFRCYEFVRHNTNACTVHRNDRRRRPAFASLYNYCLAGAKVRGKTWSIPFSAFKLLCKLPSCFYCGVFLHRVVFDAVDHDTERSRMKTKMTMWLDRVDTTVGYDVDNVVPCCRACNCKKGWRRSGEQMLALVATESGDTSMVTTLARGVTWRQVYKTWCARHLSDAEVRKLCR